jgi:hypothetical protein
MQQLSVEQRKALLAKHVASLVTQGRRIETQSLISATLTRGRFLTYRELVSVDEWGNHSVETFPPRRSQILQVVTVGLIILVVILFIVIRVIVAVT